MAFPSGHLPAHQLARLAQVPAFGLSKALPSDGQCWLVGSRGASPPLQGRFVFTGSPVLGSLFFSRCKSLTQMDRFLGSPLTAAGLFCDGIASVSLPAAWLGSALLHIFLARPQPRYSQPLMCVSRTCSGTPSGRFSFSEVVLGFLPFLSSPSS